MCMSACTVTCHKNSDLALDFTLSFYLPHQEICLGEVIRFMHSGC